jgi:hypothetical protein
MNDLLQWCAGNPEAADWLTRWQAYVHAIDDQIDGDVSETERAEHLLRLFAGASELYTHPFFVRHAARLQLLIVLVTSAYADSVAFERSGVTWKVQWADHWRHIGAEVALAVAYICGGYDHLRSVSPEMRSVCHWRHHDPDGKPV